MQSYNNKPKETNPFKDFVLEMIDSLRYKLESDTLSIGEWESFARILGEQLQLHGSVDEIAGYFGKSKENVKVVISRKMTTKPVRKILYSFSNFIKVAPLSWKRRG